MTKLHEIKETAIIQFAQIIAFLVQCANWSKLAIKKARE